MTAPAIPEHSADEAAGTGGAFPLALLRFDQVPNGGHILANYARKLQRTGRRVAGVIQNERRRADRRACDMFLENLTTGEELCITADRGNEARGCRLDHAALAKATLWVEQAIALNPQLLVLNKFGKEEALGRGFFPVMAEALANNVPVIAGVSALNLAAAQALTQGFLTLIGPTDVAIHSWFRTVTQSRCV